jgi:hypothetical protein
MVGARANAAWQRGYTGDDVHFSNLPNAYWIVPNTIQLDQAVVKIEREIDWLQTDHIDWGFKSVSLGGIDYRYPAAQNRIVKSKPYIKRFLFLPRSNAGTS